MNTTPRKRRPAGQRAAPQTSTLMGAFEMGTGDVNGLREEIEEWKSNLEDNNMEHLDKFSELEECLGYLETADDELQGLEVPDHLQDIEVHFTIDTRLSSSSRACRLGNATSPLYVVQAAAESWVEDNPELEANTHENEELEQDDGEEEITDTQVDERNEQIEATKEFIDTLEAQLSELDSVSFPGMY